MADEQPEEYPKTVCRKCGQSKENILFTPKALKSTWPMCRKCVSEANKEHEKNRFAAGKHWK